MSNHSRDNAFAELGQAALAALARADSGQRASAAIEANIMAALDARHRPMIWDWRRWIGIAAALVTVVGATVGWLGHARVSAPAPGTDVAGEFVEWPGAASLPAFESGVLVRTELPATALPLLGIPQADAPADGHVIADVLYGQDGEPRAVRIVGLRP